MKAHVQKQILILLILMSGSLFFAQTETPEQGKQHPKKSNPDLYTDWGWSFEFVLEEYEIAYKQKKISSFRESQNQTIAGGQRSSCPNDDVCNAIALTMNVPEPFINYCATAQTGEVSPGGGTPYLSCTSQNGWCDFEVNVQNSLWYTFIAPASGVVSIVSPEFDTQLALWTVGDCADFGTFTEIAANDDTGLAIDPSANFAAPAIINANVIPGETYYIQLDGWNGATGAGTIRVIEMNIDIVDIYTDRSEFEANACNLQLEDFEGSNAEPGTFSECAAQEPLNKNTEECYPPGEIIPGFTLHGAPFGQVNALAEGFLGLTSTVVGLFSGFDNAFLKFDCGTKSVGFDLISINSTTATFAVSAFGPSGILNSVVVTNNSFIGFVSEEDITFIQFRHVDGIERETFDNLTFGTSCSEQPDADCDGVADACDLCPEGDDSVDNNADHIPDCSQLLEYDEYDPAWQCGSNKLYICHVDDQNIRNTICVNENSLQAHMNHNDWVGPCISCGNQAMVIQNGGPVAVHNTLVPVMELFPNPAASKVNIHLHNLETDGAVLAIYDYLGREVLRQELAKYSNQLEIELSKQKFHNGEYIVQVVSGQEVLTKLLVVTK